MIQVRAKPVKVTFVGAGLCAHLAFGLSNEAFVNALLIGVRTREGRP